MTRGTTPLAVAADYADALMTARRAKNILFLLLALIIVLQIALFCLAKFNIVGVGTAGPVDASQPAAKLDIAKVVPYAIPVLNFAGVAFSIILTVVTLLLVTIMLVGRLIGVSSVTSAFIWGVLLVVLILPWQTLFISDGDYPLVGASASEVEQPAFKLPGVLYTYAELRNDHADKPSTIEGQILHWGRYVGWPVLALLVLMIVQVKSSRGLRYALGEADVHVEITSRQEMGPMS